MENSQVIENVGNVQPPMPTAKDVKKKVKKLYSWSSMVILMQIIIVNCIVMGLAIVLAILFTVFGFPSEANDFTEALELFNMPLTGVGYVIGNIASALIALKVTKVGKLTNWYKKPEKFSALDIGMSCFAISGVAFIVVTLLSFCGTLFSNTSETVSNNITSGILSDNIVVTVMTIAYVAVLGPITEEILCRGAILNISSAVSRRFALVASAVLFGLMHGNFIQIINATIMGLFLAYVAEKTKSLVAPTILHIFNNSLSVISAFITEKWFPGDTGLMITNIMTYAIMVLGVISMILILRKHGKVAEDDGMVINKVVSEGEIAVVEKKTGALTGKLFFTTVPFILVVIFALVLTIYAAM